MRQDEIRMADLLAALSVATDLGMALAPEQCIRTCLVATSLARQLGLPEAEVSDVYYTTLVRHLGCTATTHEEAYLFGPDELSLRPRAERTDDANHWEVLGLLARVGTGGGVRRPQYLARALKSGAAGESAILRAVCEVGSQLSEQLGLGAAVSRALYQILERWDGAGHPERLAGEEIARPARLVAVASQAVIFDRLGGPDAAVAALRQRSGGWLDPEAVAEFEIVGPKLLREVDAVDMWQAVLDAEPLPYRCVPADQIDAVARAFGYFVDLKSPYLFGHSTGVAALAEQAGRVLRLGDETCLMLRQAGLFHDLGRVAVPTGVWEKPGPLGRGDWERVRLHPYHTERILGHSEALAPLARLAGAHHERRDGSGYPRQSADGSPAGYALAAADAYQALTQERPHRAALSRDEAATTLLAQVRAGALDSEAANAVLVAAGHRPRRKAALPAGLSVREVQVLRLLARGLSNPEIARKLVMSRRTAEHHVQHIYTKLGVSTRAGAAVYAMRHGLLAE